MQSIQLRNDTLIDIATFLVRRWSEKENVVVDGIKYDIERHKKGHIRIYIDGKGDPLKGSKGILKKIDKAKKLGLTEKDWLQTQRAGKAVINKLKEQKS